MKWRLAKLAWSDVSASSVITKLTIRREARIAVIAPAEPRDV